MKTYDDMKGQILKFLKESGINPYDLVRIAKDICCCGKCKHFVPHYLVDGKLTDFGHCTKNKIPKACRPREISCGYWEMHENALSVCNGYINGCCICSGPEVVKVDCGGDKDKCDL